MHYHVASGIAGYGPDCDEGTPTFESLAGALDYARDELSTYVDMAHEHAHDLALHASQYHAAFKLDPARDDMQAMALDHYAQAWEELERAETLDTLRANLDPARASAPLYRHDPSAYAALQQSQADEFPHDVSDNARLYLWVCSQSDEDCREDDVS